MPTAPYKPRPLTVYLAYRVQSTSNRLHLRLGCSTHPVSYIPVRAPKRVCGRDRSNERGCGANHRDREARQDHVWVADTGSPKCGLRRVFVADPGGLS